MTAAPEPTRIPKRTVRTRRIAFAYPTGASTTIRTGRPGDEPRRGRAVRAVPRGRGLLLRSVRRHANQITDPELKSQVAGFIGRRSRTGGSHRALNDRLREMGYPTRLVDRFTHYLMIRSDRFFPRRFQLPSPPRSSTTPPPSPSACSPSRRRRRCSVRPRSARCCSGTRSRVRAQRPWPSTCTGSPVA